jgi:RNA polymerase sigma-70 factor (ECF subfamily)
MPAAGPELLGQLLDAHGAALALYARQWCVTPEDVVQEAFVQLARQPCAPAQPVGWLYRVVRNGAISAARSANRRRHYETAVAARGEPWFTPTTDSALDIATATAALERLSIELRETIVARLWGGLSFDEIAELTGTSSSTAHRRYVAGLSQLRERLGVSCPAKQTLLET